MDANILQSANLNSVGLAPHFIFGSIFYSILGLLLMVAFLFFIDKVFQLEFRKELLEDQNVALGILFAGITIAIAIIIASAIHS